MSLELFITLSLTLFAIEIRTPVLPASDYVGPGQVDCPTGFFVNETGTLFLAFFSSVMTKPSTLLLRSSVIGIKF